MRKLAVAALMLGALAVPALAQDTPTSNPAQAPGARQQDAPNVVPPTDSTRAAQSGNQTNASQTNASQTNASQTNASQTSADQRSAGQSQGRAFDGDIEPLPRRYFGEWTQVDTSDDFGMRVRGDGRVQYLKDASIWYGWLYHNPAGGVVLSNDQLTCTFDVVFAANYQTMIWRQTSQVQRKTDAKACPKKAIFLRVDEADGQH